jgi:hypothetical protein
MATGRRVRREPGAVMKAIPIGLVVSLMGMGAAQISATEP